MSTRIDPDARRRRVTALVIVTYRPEYEGALTRVPGPYQMAGDIRGRNATLRPGSIVFAQKASGSSRTTCSDATIACALSVMGAREGIDA